MKCLKITNRKDVAAWVDHLKPECLISIRDHRQKITPVFKRFEGPKLEMVFDDLIGSEKTAPRYDHVIDLIEFAQANKNKTFVINCSAGVSRSSASALILEYVSEEVKSEDGILERLLEENPQIFPNEKIVLMADDILKTNFFRACADWSSIMKYRFELRHNQED